VQRSSFDPIYRHSPVSDLAIGDKLVFGSVGCVQISLPVAGIHATSRCFVASTYSVPSMTSGLNAYLRSSLSVKSRPICSCFTFERSICCKRRILRAVANPHTAPRSCGSPRHRPSRLIWADAPRRQSPRKQAIETQPTNPAPTVQTKAEISPLDSCRHGQSCKVLR